jgi:hypothetical protein
MPKPGSYFRAAYFFGAVPLLLGLWACVVGVRDEINDSQSASWPTTEGRALWLEKDRVLAFNYVANGTKYRRTWHRFSDSGDLAAYRLGHPEGSVATVRYDPGNPAVSRLDIETPPNVTGVLGPGLVIFGCASVFLIVYWRTDQGLAKSNRRGGVVFSPVVDDDPMAMAMLLSAASLFVILGLLGIGYGVTSSWKTVRASFWPTAPAEIVHMKIDVSVSDSSKPDRVSRKPTVAYRYSVNGKTYFSSLRRFGATGASIEQHMIASYPVGTRVVAFYSPDNPQIDVLEAGFDSEHLIWPAVGLLPILFVAMFYWVVRFVGRPSELL